jgi:hypothetical protein
MRAVTEATGEPGRLLEGHVINKGGHATNTDEHKLASAYACMHTFGERPSSADAVSE